MTLEPPQPPTAPAPAIRPTPPTPPRIDKAPFAKADSGDVNEDMARDAVANGSGALTKRSIGSPNASQSNDLENVPQITNTQSDYERGQDVLQEFQELDAQESQSTYNFPAQTSQEQTQTSTPKFTHQEGNGAVFWIFTIIFVAVATFFIVKKFLLTDKPALTKSQLFEDDKKATTNKPALTKSQLFDDNKKATADKLPPPKPARLPKKDDDKGKRFEVRI